jgi:hypothetical protein
MGYFLNPANYNLTRVATRIRNTDLTPGIHPIKADLDTILDKLRKAGITGLADLRASIKTKAKALKLAADAEISPETMILLRREVEGWFRDKVSIDEFSWIDTTILNRLKNNNMVTIDEVYDQWNSIAGREALQALFRNEKEALVNFCRVIDLTRIRWVSPVVARILVEAGYDSVDKIRKADVEELAGRFDECNKRNRYFKGKIGVRDMKRLIDEARYVE